MKAYKKLFALLPLMAVSIVACNDLEDRDYFDNTDKTNENVEVVSVDQTSANYIETREDLSRMDTLFQKTGVWDEMEKKGTLHTIFVVVDSAYKAPTAERDTFIAKSHITDVAVSPSKLRDGDRLLMWHEKYVKIVKDPEAEQGNIINHIHFNNASLQEVISTKDGFIYVISEMIDTPQSLEDYINALDDAQYSMFKEMVLSSGGKVFDRANSKIIGVDDRGNTLYDTVWIYSNDFFDAKNFSLSSESLTATMFTFSNAVIEDAMERADSTLRAWGYRSGAAGSADYIEGRSDSILRRWILEVAFFNQSYSVADLTPKVGEDESGVNDIKSIYDRQWRTSQQTLDLAQPVQLSNGIAYDVTHLRIPNNVLIYRLKENFYYYEYCTDEEKNTYFKMDNLAFSECKTEVDAWTPLAGVWPMHSCRTLILKQVDANNKTFNLDFTPIRATSDGSGAYAVSAIKVPQGTYRLAMGFKQNLNVSMDISLCSVIGPDTVVLATNTIATDGTVGTAFHYDRGSTLSNTYPEGYSPKDPSVSGEKKAGNYDTDGGLVFQEVKVEGPEDGSAVQVLIRIHAAEVGSVTKYVFNHWCLRPTTNNY